MMRALALALLLATGTARADGVYVGIDKRGVVHFDGKRATTVAAKPRFPVHLVKTPNGVLWIGATAFLYRLDRGKLVETPHVPVELTARDGVVWVANARILAWSADGTRWSTLAMPEATADAARDQLAVDGRGRAWITFGDELMYTTARAKRWSTFAAPESFRECELAARGDLYVACRRAVYRLANDRWTTLAKLDGARIERFAVGADGAAYVAVADRVHVIAAKAAPRAFAVPSWYLRAFVVDDRGRLWFGHDDGLSVYDRAGEPLELPAALATTARIGSLLVEGKGPSF